MYPTSSQHHSFDIALASKYGVEESILIHHFLHWIRINRRANRNIKEFEFEGVKFKRCFTYQSRKEIQLHFPYWNYDKVKYLCEKLVAEGVLFALNFNKSPIDKTLWYAFVDEHRFYVDEKSVESTYQNSNNSYEGQKCPTKGKSAQPIPDTKTPDRENTSNTSKEETGNLAKDSLKIPDYIKPLKIPLEDKLRLSLVNESCFRQAMETAKLRHKKGKVKDINSYVVGTALKIAEKLGHKLDWASFYETLNFYKEKEC